jgi:prepilin-type N-terminal cleavage/methylation domain-containing protein
MTFNGQRGTMRNKQKGFSLIELLIVVAIILIIAAIAIPNLLRARIAANEASAASSLRTINTACITYNSTYGGYPLALSSLGPSNGATPTSTTADLLDQVLAPTGGGNVSTNSGYVFTYTGSQYVYNTQGAPASLNQTGVRYFYSDQSGVIRYAVGVAATSGSSPL